MTHVVSNPGSQPDVPGAAAPAPKRLNLFERYLSLWVGLCMAVGILIGRLVPAATDALRKMEFGAGSQINVPIAVLIWLMIIPMMMKVDFGAIREVGRRPRGLFVTLFVNWLVKPFSMALFAWLFFRYVFAAWIPPADADQYIAGVHHPRGRALHGDGVRVELSHGRRPGVYPRAGVGERPHHARALRANRQVSRERRVFPGGAVHRPAVFGRRLHRDPVDDRRGAAPTCSSRGTGRRGSSSSCCPGLRPSA